MIETFDYISSAWPGNSTLSLPVESLTWPRNNCSLTLCDKIVTRCLPNHGQIYDHDRTLPTKTYHLPSGTARRKPLSLLPCSSPWRGSGWKSGVRHCALRKTGRSGIHLVRYFQEKVLQAQFLASSHIFSKGNIFLVTNSKLLPKCVLDYMNPSLPSSYIYSSPPLPLQSSPSELSQKLSPGI